MKTATARRLLAVGLTSAVAAAGIAVAGPSMPPALSGYLQTHAGTSSVKAMANPKAPATTPRARCGPGSTPETGRQGRVPLSDYESGRAAKGYTCNAKVEARVGATGGFKTLRYTDRTGRVCAFYDGTLLFPTAVFHKTEAGGVHVLDMSDPTRPIETARLVTQAMNSPHESLVVSQKSGLLAAAWGSPLTAPGVVDIYDVSQDCRYPKLRSSTPLGILGHESGFSPDGRTLWISTTAGPGVSVMDVSNPLLPSILLYTRDYTFHGMGFNATGYRLYGSQLGGNPGLAILDVSDIQRRLPDPKIRQVSFLTWPEVSIPQNSFPVTIKSKKYLVQFDEYARSTTSYQPDDAVGAARIISLEDERRPKVISRMRLEVHQPEARAGDQRNDPGAQYGVQGYAAHYCATPRSIDPGIIACSFILSGLRVFDISDPYRPREVAYANYPAPNGFPLVSGAYAMSAPAFDLKHRQVWYTDGDAGFFAVRLTNGAWPRTLR